MISPQIGTINVHPNLSLRDLRQFAISITPRARRNTFWGLLFEANTHSCVPNAAVLPWSEYRPETECWPFLQQPRKHIKKQRHYFANKGLSSQGYGFSSGHVWMWELDCEESWAPKNWRFWTIVLETLESPLDCKIQPVHPKGDQSWVLTGRTDVESETLILWPTDAKSWLIWKDPDAGKDWRQEKGTTEDEMVAWHHRLNGHEFR